MNRQWGIFCLFICVFVSVGAQICGADMPTTLPQTEQDRLQDWWNDLQKSDPQASRALLNFSTVPEKA